MNQTVEAPQKVKFICNKYKELTMVYKPEQSAQTFDSEGRQMFVKVPGKNIKFSGSIYETTDAEEIEFIRNHPHFTGKEDKKVIVEALPPDPYQQAIFEAIKQHGYQAVAMAITGKQQTQELKPQQNPVAATLQHSQQQYQPNYQQQNVVPMPQSQPVAR